MTLVPVFTPKVAQFAPPEEPHTVTRRMGLAKSSDLDQRQPPDAVAKVRRIPHGNRSQPMFAAGVGPKPIGKPSGRTPRIVRR